MTDKNTWAIVTGSERYRNFVITWGNWDGVRATLYGGGDCAKTEFAYFTADDKDHAMLLIDGYWAQQDAWNGQGQCEAMTKALEELAEKAGA